jgi:uncharacterized LabA/DUF88 family protein
MCEKRRLIAYVDGFSLYYGLRSKGWRRLYWLNIRELVRNLLPPDGQLVRVKYFTSSVSPTRHDPDKHKRQETFLDALATLADFEIIYGRYELRRQACPRCGFLQICINCHLPQEKHTEKKTDVNIAVELLTDAVQGHFDTAMLISGDSDLTPAVERAKQLAPLVRIVVASPPDRVSRELCKAADRSFTIGESKLRKSLFPDTVTTPTGFALKRPDTWH